MSLRRDEKAQLHVIEAIIVGVLVFTILSITAVFRVPTNPATFQQAELAGLATDTLSALAAKPPQFDAECNAGFDPCPFDSELERMISLALGYEGTTIAGVTPDTGPLTDYLNQSLPPGTRYIISYSNGVSSVNTYPRNLVPPSLDVSVGHRFMSFNWSTYSNEVDRSTIIRINELTGFTGVTTIHDALNRDKDEYGVTHLSSFAEAGDRVPNQALYGTYRVCAPSCSYFTVVPPGVFGAGSSILAGDRDNSTSLQAISHLHHRLRFNDTSNDNTFQPGDAMYLDLTPANATGARVELGDLRLSTVPNCRVSLPCPAGSFVEAGDIDLVSNILLDAFPVGADYVRPAAGANSAVLEESDAIYWDADNSATVTAGDRRFSRVGVFAFGSEVQGGDPDVGVGLVTGLHGFNAFNLVFGDLDAGGPADLDVGEPIYLDLAGNGQSVGLESFDLHLSPKGGPTARYIYDIRLVVWYGI
jgi:hypothetical protein